MAWLILLIAGIFEFCWAVALKYSHGFTRFVPSAIVVVAMGLSVFLLSVAAKTLPLGTAYAVWTGIGVLGTVIYGMIFFHEPVTVIRIVCLVLIVCGIAGLRLFHGE